MIQTYVDKFIENLPDSIKNNKEPIIIDLVLDGGAFNGSYLIGALYFLKKMEKLNYIKVNRISGASIGSVIALFYFLDNLDLAMQLYELTKNNFKKKYNLKIVKNLKTILKDHIPENFYLSINNKLFISYHNIIKRKKIVKSKYENNSDMFDTIIKSCFVPYLIDGNCLYENKYIDGILPYVFNKKNDSKILYLNILSYNKIFNILNIKNENTNYHRVLTGLIDVHNFFIKESSTDMCSYVNNWTILNVFNRYVQLIFQQIIIYIIYIFIIFKKYILKENCCDVLFKPIKKIYKEIVKMILKKYFI
jgi:hypothetical protein